MNLKKKTGTIFTILLLYGTILNAQIEPVIKDSLDKLVMRASIMHNLFPEERVYMHFDNTAYYLTEEIWFKAYVMSGVDERPTNLSKVLYVELVAPEGYVVETKKYRIEENGTCTGNIHLSPLLLSGYYEIRAYTRYMMNRDGSAVFSRVFPIFDKVNGNNWDFKNMLDRPRAFLLDSEDNDGNTGMDVKKRWINSKHPDVDVAFYPEGGHLVYDIENNVAYEVRGKNGIPAEDSITLYADDKELLHSCPVHMGKGTFRFTPQEGVKYMVRIYKDGKEYKFRLPETAKEGVTINLSGDRNIVNISVKNNLKEFCRLGCAIIHRGYVAFYDKFQSEERTKFFSIDKSTLHEGVNRFIIFIDDSIPLAERQFFVTHNTMLPGDRSTAKLNITANNYHPHNLTLKPHEKINVTIEREDGKPIEENATLSLSVYDATNNQETSYGYNIYSYMLLGSEVKGYIPNAEQYFDHNNPDREKWLDLVMLTHGWSSYDWHKLAIDSVKLKQPIEKGISVKGRFIKKVPSKKIGKLNKYNIENIPNKEILLKISNKDYSANIYEFHTDAAGEFLIKTDDFYGKRIGQLIPTDSHYRIEDTIFSIALEKYFSPRMQLFDYWQCNAGKSGTENDVKRKTDETIQVNPFEYLLTQVDVVAKKKKEKNWRPPRSEMRLDFLDEWEYAQDVTYLSDKFDPDETGDRMYLIQDYARGETNAIEGHQYYIDESDNQRNELSGWEERIFGSSNHRYVIPTPVFSNTNSSINPMHIGVLTAGDVLRSAFWRHNINWSYRVQGMVVAGEYNSSEVPTVDEQYIKGVDPEKMMRFKEIIIRSDEKTREQFKWQRPDRSIKSYMGYNYKQFYTPFLDGIYIEPRNNEGDDEIDRNIFEERVIKQTVNSLPDYVGCFIPYTEEEQTKKIVPHLTEKSHTRYTMIQGYTESKQFYSPDYSGMHPDSITNDFRRTLLWQPYTDIKNGKIELELFNSSQADKIAISIDGYGNNTYYSNSGNIETRINSNKNILPAVNIPNTDIPALMAYSIRQNEEGRSLYMQKRYKEAFEKFNNAAELDFTEAQYNVAVCYLYGRGTEQNHELAFLYFNAAARKGNLAAMHNLASCYMNGRGIEQNATLAARYYLMAAEKNHPESQTMIANCYLDGIGVEKDSATAYQWYNAAAENEQPHAIFMIGKQFARTDSLSGKKRLRNSPTLKYFEKAAKYGFPEAQWQLARFYETGRYVRKNKKKAFKWYLHAANNGHMQAQEKVGLYYEKGRVVRKNFHEAAKYYRKAEAQGSKMAKQKMVEYNTFKFFGNDSSY